MPRVRAVCELLLVVSEFFRSSIDHKYIELVGLDARGNVFGYNGKHAEMPGLRCRSGQSVQTVNLAPERATEVRIFPAAQAQNCMLTGKRLHNKVLPYAKRLRGVDHPHRLAILYLLAHEPMWPRDLAIHLNLPPNLISHHLREMLKAGWVVKEKERRWMLYKLNLKAFGGLRKLLKGTKGEKNIL